MAMYDLCVVGAGMIGSAAARHASRDPGLRVCLVGPSEPKGRSLDDRRDIFGSHYDEGRITRSCDPDPTWAKLAQESIKRYRKIEKESGIPFYHEVGTLMAGTSNSTYMNNVTQNARRDNIPFKELKSKELHEQFPYLKMADSDVGVVENKNAGHINPRNLVEAQKVIARKQGCKVIDDVVSSIERVVQLDGSYSMRVVTEGGNQIISKAVLVATGAFTNNRQVLPRGVELAQKLFGLTVALIEVEPSNAEKLKCMPTVIYRGAGRADYCEFPRNADSSVSYYMLPPIRYPDGRDYVKLGFSHSALPVVITTGDEAKQWFVRGNSKMAEMTEKFTKSLFAGIQWKSWWSDSCVVIETPTSLPYLDTVHAQLGVAIGGNGYAAKSSDELGRLAADMMAGRWTSELSRDLFKLQFARDNTQYVSNPKL